MRKDAIRKCYKAAFARGYHYFALQDGGECLANDAAGITYKRYGRENKCKEDGKGGPWAIEAYEMTSNLFCKLPSCVIEEYFSVYIALFF